MNHDTLHQGQILLMGPFIMTDRGIKMIEPSFPALFATSEEDPIRFNVELGGYLVPFNIMASFPYH